MCLGMKAFWIQAVGKLLLRNKKRFAISVVASNARGNALHTQGTSATL